MISNTAYTPLELLNLYYSGGLSTGNKEERLWQKMNTLLSWDNLLNQSYQSDLCPLLYYIIARALPGLKQGWQTDIVPAPIMMQLQTHYQNSLIRNLVLLEELNRIVRKLKGDNIKTAILKGGFLAEN